MSSSDPFARIKNDENNCFGMLEWQAIRTSTHQALPRHFPVTCWKHAATSEVEQPRVDPAPKDRGAERGDADGPLECSLTLGDAAVESRHQVHDAQRRGIFPWEALGHEAAQEAPADFDRRSENAAA